MKKLSLFALCLGHLFNCSALAEVETTSGFIAELNQKWAASDYAGILTVIESRLQLKGSQDLVGLMAKCDYYAIINYDVNVLQATAGQAKVVIDALDWTSDKEALELLNAGITDYENPQDAQARGYIFGLSQQQLQDLHGEFPNKYPMGELLQRFGDIQYP